MTYTKNLSMYCTIFSILRNKLLAAYDINPNPRLNWDGPRIGMGKLGWQPELGWGWGWDPHLKLNWDPNFSGWGWGSQYQQ